MQEAAAESIKRLDASSFELLLAHQDPFGNPRCTFDLSRVTFVAPAALVLLANACHALAVDRRVPTISLGGRRQRSYLVRTGFISLLQPVAHFQPWFPAGTELAYDYYFGTNPMLIEITKIEGEEALPDLLDRVIQALLDQLGYRRNDALAVAQAVSEVTQNIFDHNEHACGFLAMQGYQSSTRVRLEIGIGDCGAGLTATLRRNPKNPPISSDVEAIRLATQLRTSRHDDPTRGTGLYHLLQIAAKHRGSVHIRSGAGKVYLPAGQGSGRYSSVTWMPGVQVAVTFRSAGWPSRFRARDGVWTVGAVQ